MTARSSSGLLFLLALALCLWFPFQDLVLAFLYGRGVPATAIRGLLVLKEAMLVTIVGGAMLRWTLGTGLRPRACDLLAIVYAAVLTTYLPIGDAELQPRLAQYRSLGLPVLLYFGGRALPATRRALHTWIRLTVWLAIVLSALGLAERLFLPIDFWHSTVPLGTYLVDVKSQAIHMYMGLPGNMFGDYGFGFFQFRRMAGVFGSPLTMGYYLVFPIVLAICVLLQRRPGGREETDAAFSEKGLRGLPASVLFPGLVLCCLALLLTVTRVGAGAVIVAVGLALPLYRQVRLLIAAVFFCVGICVLFQDVLFTMLYNTVTMNDSSVLAHYEFLTSSVDVILEHPLGMGMGTAGGWAHTMSSSFSGAAENAFLVIVAQTGSTGAMLFLLFCFAALAVVWRADVEAPHGLQSLFFRAVLLSSLAYLLTGLLSEQILTFTSVAHFWISLGYAVTLAQNWATPDCAGLEACATDEGLAGNRGSDLCPALDDG